MRAGLSTRLLGGAAVAGAVLLVAQCGGGEPPILLAPGNPDGGLDISGYAVKGPIFAGTVTAYKLLPDMTRGEQLATTTTDESGFFGLSLPAFNGDVLLAVNGGSYVEEALGDGSDGGPSLSVNVDFFGVLLGYQAGQPATANITPVSHLAYALATYHVRSLGEPVQQAVADAYTHLGAHFGNIPGVATDLDWLTVVPTSLGAGNGAQLTAAQRAGLILAGLSELAATISNNAGISPGGEVNALSLVTALAEDVEADGVFDGLGTGGQQLVLPAGGSVNANGPTATALDGSTVRVTLASAIANFVVSSSNASSVTIPDTTSLTGALSSDADPYLFDSPGTPFDVTPPTLTVVSAPPAYTNQNTVNFSVTADVGPSSTGVKMVVAVAGDGTILTGVNTSGDVWTFSNAPTGGAHSYFDVWGVDDANNSGEQFPVGLYHLRLPCLQDQVPPTIVQDFSVPSYLDERAMQLTNNAVPAQFTWPGSLPAAVGPGPDVAIWKSSVTLSWGAMPPTGANLEDGNTTNVPYVQVGIPFNASTDAPIASVTYSIFVEGAATSMGSTIPAQRTGVGILYFDLPFTGETILGLASASTSPVTFTAFITATDAAGNSTTNQLESSSANTFVFHIIGPPLYVQQDTSYASEGDTKSIYPFALANGTYPNKFAGDNGGEIARQARFIVYNPYSVDVPFSTAFQSYESTGAEEWDDSVWMAGSIVWDVTAVCSTGPPCDYLGPEPQPFVTSPGSASYACEASSSPKTQSNPAAVVFITSTGETSAWQLGAGDLPTGGYGNRNIVPAAQAGDAGAIVVYVGRAWSSFGLPPYTFSTYSNPDGVLRFYRFLQDLWQRGASEGAITCNCIPHPPGPPVCAVGMLYQYPQLRWTNVLSAASESFSATWAYESYAGLTPTSDLGDGALRSINTAGTTAY
ncbi:MAG: hypothetical protein ACLPJH_06130 [Myxococcaceae bacterium]